jgi:hypothetical protein
MLGTAKTLTAWHVPAALLREGANRVELTSTAHDSTEIAYLDLSTR